MAETLKSVYDARVPLDVNAAFAQKLIDFSVSFVNKNADHVKFFGSALIGVYPIRWVNSDLDRWYDDILGGVDEVDLRKALHAVPGIDPSWVRGGDETNHSMLYVLHVLENSTLPEDLRCAAQIATLNLLQYKFLSSLMFHYFPHPASMSVALATYNALSKKFDLRVSGSWGALIQQRSEDIIAPNSIHRKAYREFKDPKAVVYMITDIQGRLRSVVKNITAIFYMVKEANGGVVSESVLGESEDGVFLKDKSSAVKQYTTYFGSIVNDRNGFIKRDLLRIINNKMSTSRDWLVEAALVAISERYGDAKHPEIAELCTEALLHAFDTMLAKKITTNDYPKLLDTLKKTYMASRETSAVVLTLRKLADQLVLSVLPPGRSNLVAPERGAILLYIVLRALVKHRYA